MFEEEMKHHLLTPAILLSLTGCSFFIIGDGYMKVSGELVGYQKQNCELKLGDHDSDRVYRTSTVEGKFSTGITVAPSKQKYTLVIMCDNEIALEKVVQYPNDLDSNGNVNLGISVFLQ